MKTSHAKTNLLSIAILAGLLGTHLYAQETTIEKPNATQKQAKVQGKQQTSMPESADVPVADMPTVGPWEIDGSGWHSFRFYMGEALHDARMHYRRGQLQAAKAEIKEAINWLRYAKHTAKKSSRAELQNVIVELNAVANSLSEDKPVEFKRLNRAFANAHLALAKYHLSRGNVASEKDDLNNAAKRLMAGADYLKRAANASNEVPSIIVGEFQDEYSPYGMSNQKLILTKEKVEDDLEKLGAAIEKLGQKLKQKSNTKPL